MISLIFEGKCKGCCYADVTVLRHDTFTGESAYIVTCSHEGACERMREIQERVVKDDNRRDAAEI